MTVLLLVASIVFFLTLDWAVRRNEKKHPAFAPEEPSRPRIRTPEGIFFTKSHTWMNLFPSGCVRLGIDDFIGRLVVRPDISLLKNEGDHVDRGEPIIRLGQNGHSLTIRSPIEGRVVAQNTALLAHPEYMGERLFRDGWAYTIEPAQTTELRDFIFGGETLEWIQKEFGRLRDILTGSAGVEKVSPVLLQDGGLPVAGIMRDVPDTVWRKIEQEFLIE